MTAASVPLKGVVDPGYRHLDKLVTLAPDDPSMPGLKWYEIRTPAQQIGDDIRAEARALLAGNDEFTSDDLGFVILHLCGESFYFLLVSRWRGTNELWETVYTKGGSAAFVLMLPEPTKATFCVWELGVVNHERLAWTAYLRSRRTDADQARYMAARFSGTV